MESPSISPSRQFSADGGQDNQVPPTVAPQSHPNTPVGYNMLWADEQHHFIASPHPPHSMNSYMYRPNSVLSGTRHAPAATTTTTNDGTLGSSTARHMELAHMDLMNYSPQHSANAPVSPLSPPSGLSPLSAISYFSGDGFVSQDVWAGAELINPEPCDSHAFSSPRVDDLVATPASMMIAPPRSRRSWSQMSKDGPGPPTLTRQRQRTTPKSPKQASGKMHPRRQHEEEPTQVSGSGRGAGEGEGEGDGDEWEEPNALNEGSHRRTHNLVEKQYRNRLNAQFDRLLAVLPAQPESQAEPRRVGTEDVPWKTISKAEVLGMATQRIMILEQQNSELLRRQDELIWRIESLGISNADASCVNAVLGPPPH